MQFTPDQLTKVRELQVRLSSTQTTLRNTAAALRDAAVQEAFNGEYHTATTLCDIASQMEDTANGKV